MDLSALKYAAVQTDLARIGGILLIMECIALGIRAEAATVIYNARAVCFSDACGKVYVIEGGGENGMRGFSAFARNALKKFSAKYQNVQSYTIIPYNIKEDSHLV